MPAIWILPSSSSSPMRADRLLVRARRVRAVELVEADRVHAEALQRRLARPRAGARASCRWSTSRRRGAGGRPWWRPAPRRRRRPRSQRLGDEALVVAHLVGVQVVGVGGVDQRHAGVQRRVDGREGAVAVGTALDRHGHAAQADRGDGPVADVSCLHAQRRTRGAGNDARELLPSSPTGTPGARARRRRAVAGWTSRAPGRRARRGCRSRRPGCAADRRSTASSGLVERPSASGMPSSSPSRW